MKPDDASYLRRLCVQLSAAGYGDVGYFMGIPLEELTATVNEVVKISKERMDKRKKR